MSGHSKWHSIRHKKAAQDAKRGKIFTKIIREIKPKLVLFGCSVFLFPHPVKELSEAGAEAFGVGTFISNAPTVDFAMDIVEVEGKLAAKRGKLSGKKQVWRCPSCLKDIVLPFSASPPRCPLCNEETNAMLKPLIRDGEIVADLPRASDIRDYVLDQIKKMESPI